MVSTLELGVLVAAIAGLAIAVRFRRSIQALVVNAIFGLIVLIIANAIGLGVDISIWAVLVCAIAGIPGAILVIILAYLDLAFAGSILIIA